MHLDRGAFKGYGFTVDLDGLLPLQLTEHLGQHALLRPAVHAGVDGMPAFEASGESPPLTTMLVHTEDSIQNLDIAMSYISSLNRQHMNDLATLGFGYFHDNTALDLIHITSLSVNRP